MQVDAPGSKDGKEHKGGRYDSKAMKAAIRAAGLDMRRDEVRVCRTVKVVGYKKGSWVQVGVLGRE